MRALGDTLLGAGPYRPVAQAPATNATVTIGRETRLSQILGVRRVLCHLGLPGSLPSRLPSLLRLTSSFIVSLTSFWRSPCSPALATASLTAFQTLAASGSS